MLLVPFVVVIPAVVSLTLLRYKLAWPTPPRVSCTVPMPPLPRMSFKMRPTSRIFSSPEKPTLLPQAASSLASRANRYPLSTYYRPLTSATG